MKIYVAGGWKFRTEIEEINEQLIKDGFNIVSKWVTRNNGINTPGVLTEDSFNDFEEMKQAEALLAVMTDDSYAYRGTFTEIGIAIGLQIPIIVVCPGIGKQISEDQYEYSHYCMTNVYYWHPAVTHVPSLNDAIYLLKKPKTFSSRH